MKQTYFIIFSIILLSCTVNTDRTKGMKGDTANKREYNLIIESVIKSFASLKPVSLEELQTAIPTTQEEFSIYYSYTYPDKSELIHESFYSMDNEIGKNAANNQGLFLKLYLELSSFVDGEYAESYYEDVDFIIEKNKVEFCEIYKNLSSSSKNKLEDHYLQYCK